MILGSVALVGGYLEGTTYREYETSLGYFCQLKSDTSSISRYPFSCYKGGDITDILESNEVGSKMLSHGAFAFQASPVPSSSHHTS